MGDERAESSAAPSIVMGSGGCGGVGEGGLAMGELERASELDLRGVLGLHFRRLVVCGCRLPFHFSMLYCL